MSVENLEKKTGDNQRLFEYLLQYFVINGNHVAYTTNNYKHIIGYPNLVPILDPNNPLTLELLEFIKKNQEC